MVRACFIGVRCWKKLFYLCEVLNETVLISVTGLDELFLSVWQTESNRLLCALLQELSLFYAGGYIISFVCGSLDLSALEGANRSHPPFPAIVSPSLHPGWSPAFTPLLALSHCCRNISIAFVALGAQIDVGTVCVKQPQKSQDYLQLRKEKKVNL